MKNPRLSILVRACLIAGLIFLAQPARVGAATLDHYVSTAGHDTGTCSTLLAACSTINYAISQAESGDTIHIGAGTYAAVSLNDNKDLTFSGAGKDATRLDGGGTTRVFSILVIVDTKINDLTLMNGASGSACGGGLAQFQGSLELTRVSITSNTANCGAGIFSEGNLTITNSAITNNQANYSGTSWGAGIYLNGTGTSATLLNVTLSGNTANFTGGGMEIRNDNSISGLTTLTNVTISENTAQVNTAIYIKNNDAHVAILNSTIAQNYRTAASGTAGILNGGSVTIRNSLLAGNDGSNCYIAVGIVAPWTSLGNNMESGATCQFSSVAKNDHQNTDPQLITLANNGGPVKTMALHAGSPAINAVTYNAPNGCPATDARLVARPFGAYCDIGAYEYNFLPLFLPFIRK